MKKILCIPIECIPSGWTFDDMVKALKEKSAIPYLKGVDSRPHTVDLTDREAVLKIPDHLKCQPMRPDECYPGPNND